MIRKISPLALICLVAGVAALGGGISFNLTKPMRPSRNDPEAVRLRAERDAVAEFTDHMVANLEIKKRESREKLPSQEDAIRFLDGLKEGWTVQQLGRVETKHVPTRRYMITNKNQRFRGGSDRQWSDIVNTIKSIDERSGFVIQSIVVSSSVNQGITYGQVVVTLAVAMRDEPGVTAVSATPPVANKS